MVEQGLKDKNNEKIERLHIFAGEHSLIKRDGEENKAYHARFIGK